MKHVLMTAVAALALASFVAPSFASANVSHAPKVMKSKKAKKGKKGHKEEAAPAADTAPAAPAPEAAH